MHDRDDDFGLTTVASGSFVQLWWKYHDSATAVIEEIAREEDPSSLQQYVHDARLLADSPLSAERLETLWRSATSGHHGTSTEGIDGRTWFRRIIEVMEPVVAAGGLTVDTADALDHRPEVIAEVVAIARRLTVRRNFFGDPVDEDELRSILVELAESGRPELALRFFVRFAVNHDSEMDADLQDAVRKAGRHFGYGEFLIERLDFLYKN
ncbi:hypothetical protein GCM10023085_27420 [Actinomadura viridis]|uniref:Uncharacterized protein n=1 Tax=Actinomadura viridis TaxID=58110 RepID=A0A931GHU0_9ACTN|nr:hypothetical protein [Actinomadura viridis]MBG6087272.1 hypothetical protein [Actinomadura viridis]